MLANEILISVPDDEIVASLENIRGPLTDLVNSYNAIVIGREPSVEISTVITGRELKDAISKNLTLTEQMPILNDFSNAVKTIVKPDSYESLEVKEERKFKRWMKKTAIKLVSVVIIILTASMAYSMVVNGETSDEAMGAILTTLTEIFKIIFSFFIG